MLESAKEFIARKQKEIKEGNAKKVKAKDIGRKGRFEYKIVRATFMWQSNLPNDKVFVIQRLERDSMIGKFSYQSTKLGDIEYRIGYYIRGQNGKMKGKWPWGQFCPLIPAGDFKLLIDRARKDGTLLE